MFCEAEIEDFDPIVAGDEDVVRLEIAVDDPFFVGGGESFGYGAYSVSLRTPSFTIRRGRRYRYYVSQLAIKNPAGQCDGPTRGPAHELESRVTEKLLAFLKSDAEVFDRLSTEGESPVTARNLVVAAKKLAARLPSLPPDDLRDLLAAFPYDGSSSWRTVLKS